MRPIDADALDNRILTTTYTEKNFWALNLLSDYVKEAPTIGGWISVKDRLPEPPAQCLVYSAKASRPRGMETATYTEWGWMTAAYFPEVTHWMPLPEPPEEESDAID